MRVQAAATAKSTRLGPSLSAVQPAGELPAGPAEGEREDGGDDLPLAPAAAQSPHGPESERHLFGDA